MEAYTFLEKCLGGDQVLAAIPCRVGRRARRGIATARHVHHDYLVFTRRLRKKMDVLSAATETVANADAMEAAAMKASKLPVGPTPPAAAAAASADRTAAAAGAATTDTAETPAGASRTESLEMDVDEGAAPLRAKDNGAAPPPTVLPAVRAAHELLLKNAEDIKSGVSERQRERSARCT